MTDRQIIVVRRFLSKIAEFMGKLSRRPVSKNSFAIFPDGGGAFHFEEEQRSPSGGDRSSSDRDPFQAMRIPPDIESRSLRVVRGDDGGI